MNFELSTIENPYDRESGGHSSRKLEEIVRKKDHLEAFKVARESLLDNTVLYEKFLAGFIKSSDSIPVELASVQNEFLTYCVELSDTEIDSLVRQFNKGLASFLITNYSRLGIDIRRKELLLSSIDKLGMNAVGIISAVEYIRARRELLGTSPAQEHGFYFEDNLDARHRIDLVEVIFLDGQIDSMNLVQIKSRNPTDAEIERILHDHREWVRSLMMDFQTFEREYTDGIPDNLTIENMTQNAEEVEELLLDMCTDPNGFNPDIFIEKLDLGDLSNKQKAWLLLKYGEVINSKIASAVDKEILSTEQAREILDALTRLTNRLMAKAKLPKNLSGVNKIQSIIAVGPKIIREETIQDRDIPNQSKKIMGVRN